MEEKKSPNLWILVGYYFGVFSFIPVFGIILGPIGGFLGGYGLVLRKRNNEGLGLWMGRIALLSGFLGAGIQLLILYMTLFRVD